MEDTRGPAKPQLYIPAVSGRNIVALCVRGRQVLLERRRKHCRSKVIRRPTRISRGSNGGNSSRDGSGNGGEESLDTRHKPRVDEQQPRRAITVLARRLVKEHTLRPHHTFSCNCSHDAEERRMHTNCSHPTSMASWACPRY